MSRSSTPPVIHAIPIDGPPTDRDHRGSSLCLCGPEPTHRDLATTAVVFIHRPWPSQEQEVAQVPASQLNEALRGPQRASVASGGLWDGAK